MFQACLDREIKSGSISAGLAARYDFAKHFEQLVASALQFGQLPVNPLSRSRSEMLLSRQRGSNKALNFCPYKRGVPRAPCQNRRISTTFAV
jgi:hypothetical protein